MSVGRSFFNGGYSVGVDDCFNTAAGTASEAAEKASKEARRALNNSGKASYKAGRTKVNLLLLFDPH